MRKKIFGIIFCTLLITTAIFPTTILGNKSDIDNDHMSSIKINSSDFGGVDTIPDWITIYENDFEQMAWNDSGAFEGPDLWHLTSVDSWSGDSCMGCFNQGNHYENDMNFNYVLSPTIDMEDVEEMVMDFYCKFITENDDDHWGIVIFDPATNEYLPHIWTASQSWKRLPYDTYGYHSNWMGPMNPMGEYQSFDVKSAYENRYREGYFRNSNGSRSYDLQIGFVFYESDESGYTNDIAEMHDVYWSGLFIDDVLIRQLVFNGSPETPITPSGPTSGNTGPSYSYSTSSTDPDGDTVKYGWDWNGDEIVDEWTGQNPSGAIVSTDHSWTTTGTYYIKVKAEDSNGAQSDFSSSLSVTITSGENHMIIQYHQLIQMETISIILLNGSKVAQALFGMDHSYLGKKLLGTIFGMNKELIQYVFKLRTNMVPLANGHQL